MKIKTVGDLRKLIKGLTDDALILPEWAYGPPADSAPAVAIRDFAIGNEAGVAFLSVQVDLEYLNQDEDDEDYDEEDDLLDEEDEEDDEDDD